jgi:hypothetical protein
MKSTILEECGILYGYRYYRCPDHTVANVYKQERTLYNRYRRYRWIYPANYPSSYNDNYTYRDNEIDTEYYPAKNY